MAPDQGPGRIPDDATDAFDHWMTRFTELDDLTVDELLRGEVPAGHEELAPLAELAAAVRERATARGPEMGPALRQQIQARPHVPPRYAGMARRRLQLAGAAAVGVLIVGAAATQNALPAAAQRLVSSAADVVGVHIPRPEDDDLDEEAPGATTDDTSTPSGSTEPTDATGAPDPTGGAQDPAGTPGDGTPSGPPEETPGGAIPADPGAPGDGEPATPATPPDRGKAGENGGGRDNENSDEGDTSVGSGTGGGREIAPVPTNGQGAREAG